MMNILEARDKRVALIEKLLKDNVTVISLRCNYPGRDKNNSYTQKVISVINDVIVNKFSIISTKYISSSEGPVYIYTLGERPDKVKLHALEIENNHFLGRLVDIDVYYQSLKSLSRNDFSEKSRQCFLCDDYAHNCIVTKRHSQYELSMYFHQLVDRFEKLPIEIIEYTNQAMLYELFIEPSFGLVTPYSKGSHKDMDHYTFIDSISVLNKYMLEFAYLGFQNIPLDKLLNEAIKIGKDCEKAMYSKTNGINTHKGLIFVLGSIVVSTMKTIYDGCSFNTIFTNIQNLTQPKMRELENLQQGSLTNGEKIYLSYKIAGVRKEASLGFPIIQKALKLLNLNDRDTYIKTLIYIMSLTDDTTIINRKGLEGLNYVKKTMKNLYENGYDENTLAKINHQFIKEGISPGGSADLLCGTIFLSLIKNNIYRRREK